MVSWEYLSHFWIFWQILGLPVHANLRWVKVSHALRKASSESAQQDNPLSLTHTVFRGGMQSATSVLTWSQKKKKNVEICSIMCRIFKSHQFHFTQRTIAIMNKRCTKIEVIRFHAPVCLLCDDLSESFCVRWILSAWFNTRFIRIMRAFYI